MKIVIVKEKPNKKFIVLEDKLNDFLNEYEDISNLEFEKSNLEDWCEV